MANVIKLKRGTSTPTTSDISNGEVAIDTSAKKLYVNDSGTVKEIGGGSGGGVVSDSDNNTVGGTNAGDSITNGSNNTFFGYNAGTAITSQNRNTAFGSEALAAASSTSGDNAVFGHEAGKTISSGTGNTCLGRRAGQSITNETGNTIAGFMADSEGNYNVCLGQQAGQNSTGSNSVVIGTFAGQDFTNSSNHFIGYECAKDATSATENVCIGRGSARDLSSGSKNVIIGHDSANSGSNDLASGDNNIIIGHDAAASAADVDNEITLGDTNITKFRVPALNFIVKSSTATEGHVLTVDANGEAGFAAASGGGGSWNLISTTTVSSSVSSVDFTSIGSYNRYVLLWDCEMDGNNIPKIQIYDNGSLLTSSNYVMMRSEFSSSGTTTIQTSFSGWITTDSLKSQIGMFEISVAAPRATVSCTVRGLKDSSNNGGILFTSGGMSTSYSLTDIDGFRFTTTAGTAVIDSGRFSLYGIGQ